MTELPDTSDSPECIVAKCSRPGTVLMEIDSLGGHFEQWFCEVCARDFESCWRRVEPAAQLTLDFAE